MNSDENSNSEDFNYLEDETISYLIGILGEEEDNGLITEYSKDQITISQFDRMKDYARFIAEIFLPFPNYEEKETMQENGTRVFSIKTSDDEGILHTCYYELKFISDKERYIIKSETCQCPSVYDSLVEMFPHLISQDNFRTLLCISFKNNIPLDYEERIKSMIKMYAGNNLVEAWTHIGFLAEQLTRRVYLNTYTEEDTQEIKKMKWNSLLKRLENEKDKPIIQHIALLLDSIRPLRNETTHHDYIPSLNDVEFGMFSLGRICNLYFSNPLEKDK